jgi:DNA-binding transcriptional LysR family regulator
VSEVSVRQLRCFVAVYAERSFTRAAKALGMAQSPVSQAVATLEAQLGEVLFERSTRDVVPTAAAHALYPEAVEIRRRVEALPHVVASSRDRPHARRLRLGAVSSVFPAVAQALVPALGAYSLDIVDGGSAQLGRALDAGDLDVVLVRDVASSAEQRIALRERFVVAVPEPHPLAPAASVRVGALAGEPLILFERERAPVAFDLIAAVFLRAGQTLRVASRVASEQAMLGLVSAGLGVALVPRLLTLHPWPGVAFLPLEGAEADYPLAVRVAPGDPLDVLDLITSTLSDWASAHDLDH